VTCTVLYYYFSEIRYNLKFNIQLNLIKTNFRGPTKVVLNIGIPSYQNLVIHVQYYSKPSMPQKDSLCYAEFVLRLFF
jgi:hypothetical protein